MIDAVTFLLWMVLIVAVAVYIGTREDRRGRGR